MIKRRINREEKQNVSYLLLLDDLEIITCENETRVLAKRSDEETRETRSGYRREGSGGKEE